MKNIYYYISKIDLIPDSDKNLQYRIVLNDIDNKASK